MAKTSVVNYNLTENNMDKVMILFNLTAQEKEHF